MFEKKSDAIILVHKKCRNKSTHAKEFLKCKYYQSLFSSINTSGGYTQINSILRKNRKSSATIPSSLKGQGKVLHDPNKTCNAINYYFANIGSKIVSTVLAEKKTIVVI